MDPFLGQVIMFAGNFAPRGWALCEGQLLPISSNTALFSILGTMYGGDGRTTFALPDLRGRSPISPGNGPGLRAIKQGERGGAESVTLNVNNLPAHTHNAVMSTGPDTNLSDESTGNRLAHEARRGGDALPIYTYDAGVNNMAQDAISVSSTGSNESFGVRNPYLGINYIIALQGVFPSRS